MCCDNFVEFNRLRLRKVYLESNEITNNILVHTLLFVYIADMLETYLPGRTLRSPNTMTLVVPKIKTVTYGNRSFRYVGWFHYLYQSIYMYGINGCRSFAPDTLLGVHATFKT